MSSFTYKHDSSLFLHCVDSRLEENGNWYSRLHLGPFWLGSRLQIGARIRRSLLNDLKQTSITAVELEGAVHEFSCLPGIREPVLELLFQFQKVAVNAPFLRIGEMTIVPFFFSGPGIFCAKDIPWPNGFQCRNPEIFLVTLAPGAILRGRLLVQKHHALRSVLKLGKSSNLTEPWLPQTNLRKEQTKKFSRYPWLSLGFHSRPVERVGFRIESIGPLNQQNEILVFEILTNGSISPRQALREAAVLLVHKFSSIAHVTLPFPIDRKYPETKKPYSLGQANSVSLLGSLSSERITSLYPAEQTLYNLFDVGFSQFREPLGLDLGNLDLPKERYKELRGLGLQTLGQLLERLAFDSQIFSPLLKKQRQQALLKLGFLF